HRHRGVRAGHAGGRAGRHRRGQGLLDGVGQHPVAGTHRDRSQGRRPDHGTALRAGRADGHGGGEEPPRGARRRGGVGGSPSLELNEMEKHNGFTTPMQSLGSPGEYYDMLRPYGVWAVISPFNFPMALAAGPSSGALVAGNCVVFKPAHMGVFTGLKLYEAYRDAGLPAGAFQFLSGPGSVVGDEIVNHPDVGGITFTGSYEVGMGIYKGFAKDFPKPVICEMGGKNPTIVSDKADLDKATDGVLRSAFGFGGQKCSANSRVYVHRNV